MISDVTQNDCGTLYRISQSFLPYARICNYLHFQAET